MTSDIVLTKAWIFEGADGSVSVRKALDGVGQSQQLPEDPFGYTEGEVRSQVREADVEIYAIGIFDPYAPTPEERRKARRQAWTWRASPGESGWAMVSVPREGLVQVEEHVGNKRPGGKFLRRDILGRLRFADGHEPLGGITVNQRTLLFALMFKVAQFSFGFTHFIK